jgi:hypothetical protein
MRALVWTLRGTDSARAVADLSAPRGRRRTVARVRGMAPNVGIFYTSETNISDSRRHGDIRV